MIQEVICLCNAVKHGRNLLFLRVLLVIWLDHFFHRMANILISTLANWLILYFYRMIIKNARFVISNTKMTQLPAANLPEYAFIGRSNVGKSSLINMLTSKKGLAKTSQTPGKTQLINHF